MGLIDSVVDSFRFKDTVIYKSDSDLQRKYDALTKLNERYPHNEELKNELYIVKKGLDGENEIEYQLKKSNIGMYVLRDVKVKYEDLTAQIDYVIITPVYIYYVECKNLVGNITVNERGDFIRELIIDGKKFKKGMYSPLRQVEAQREVIRKIWENNTSKVKKFFASKKFEYYRRVLVVAANHETILNTYKAPRDFKSKILKADSLIRHIENDIIYRGNDEHLDSRKSMEELANTYLKFSYDNNIDYYEYYKNKYCNINLNSKDSLKDKLVEFRKNRSFKMNIPAYYVFTNDELELLLKYRPKSLDELKRLNIISAVKIKTHGNEIISLINKNK